MISAKQLSRTYRSGQTETQALKPVDIEIADGEFVAIVGKSGAGKSTLMYQLSLLDIPTTGEISINGVVVSDLSSKERTHFRLEYLGYVFQDYALVPELTAIENVMLPILMHGTARDVAEKKALKVLERLGLSHRSDRRSSKLSGGEQQRVSVARAIAHDPLILFADEPTANLDTATADELLCYMEELHKRGQTIVMVTHELEYARRAKRIIELSDGAIVREGTPGQVLGKAKTKE